jgi:hypothetical protein
MRPTCQPSAALLELLIADEPDAQPGSWAGEWVGRPAAPQPRGTAPPQSWSEIDAAEVDEAELASELAPTQRLEIPPPPWTEALRGVDELQTAVPGTQATQREADGDPEPPRGASLEEESSLEHGPDRPDRRPAWHGAEARIAAGQVGARRRARTRPVRGGHAQHRRQLPPSSPTTQRDIVEHVVASFRRRPDGEPIVIENDSTQEIRSLGGGRYLVDDALAPTTNRAYGQLADPAVPDSLHSLRRSRTG